MDDRKPYAAVADLRSYLRVTRVRHLDPSRALADLDRLAGLLEETEDVLMSCRGGLITHQYIALLSKLRAERGEGT